MDSDHNWSGSSETYKDDQTGEVFTKKTSILGFLIWMFICLLGLSLAGLSVFVLPPWLFLPGAAVAVIAVSQSFIYKIYSHWISIAVLLALGLGFLVILRRFIDLLS